MEWNTCSGGEDGGIPLPLLLLLPVPVPHQSLILSCVFAKRSIQSVGIFYKTNKKSGGIKH